MTSASTMARAQDSRGVAPQARERLVLRQQELSALLQDAAHARATEHSTDVQDFKDVAADETRAAVDDIALSHAATELAQVSAALRRLDEGRLRPVPGMRRGDRRAPPARPAGHAVLHRLPGGPRAAGARAPLSVPPTGPGYHFPMPTAQRKPTASASTESDEVFELAADIFRVMSAPMRLKIISVLCDGERNVSELLERIPTTQPNMSQHLTTLHKAGVIGRRREGVQVYYRLINDRVVTLCRAVCTQIAIESDLQ
jgi:ArsR family transcriptional regulator